MYDLFRICNLCLNELNLLDEDSNHRNIDEAIHFVLPELIILQPENAVRVCPKCLSTISDFYNFKKMCLANNATLWSSVKNVQTPTDKQKLQSSAAIRETENNSISEITITRAVTNNENPNYSLFTSEQKISDDQRLHFKTVKKEIQTEDDKVIEITSCPEVDTSNENRDDLPLKFEHVEIKSENIDLGETMYYPSGGVETSNFAESESNDDSSDENYEDDSETFPGDTNNKPFLNNMIKQTNTGEYECVLCNRLFKRKDNLVIHLKIHKNIKDFQCQVCGKGFVKREDLKDHMYVHSDTKNFECSVCHAKYSHRVSLTKHMKRHTDCSEEYECSVCNKKFTLRGSYVRHMKQHSGIKNFECFVCHRKFDRKHHRDDHIKTHTGVKDFECPVCKKKFAHKSTMTFHMRLHPNGAEYEPPQRPEQIMNVQPTVNPVVVVCTPDETVAKAAKGTENLLSQKSKEAYDKEFDTFSSWMEENSIQMLNENVLLGYFGKLAESFTPNTLWTKYSMLKKTLFFNKNVDIGNYQKLLEYLKQESKGYEGRKSKVLTSEEVLKFIREAPNKTYLMVKVALLFGILGGCRRQELVGMLVHHIEDRGAVIVVNVPATRADKKRVFMIIEEEEMNSLKLVREYAALRPPNCSESRFFLNYRDGRCFAQTVGKNTFGKIPCTIATYLDLKDADKYTGHGLRRTSASLLANVGTGVGTSKRGAAVSEVFSDDSISSYNKVPKMLVGAPSTSTNTEYYQNVIL